MKDAPRKDVVTGQIDWYDYINSTDEPIECLLALSKGNDPFYAEHGSRFDLAEWFAELWDRHNFRTNVHLRRVHYILVSQSPAVILPNGKPYENTEGCWSLLLQAGRDARYLDLIPRHAVIDARNPDVEEFLVSPRPSSIDVTHGGELRELKVELPSPPSLELEPPVIPQRYHVEIWAEKSTQNDILLPLARSYSLNLFAGAGEVSLTRCDELVGRAKASQRPVRILYISDFDPAGESMPITAARKIEFAIRNRDAELDVQVRPIALTLEQCEQFNLPRTPIKASEKRRDAFEERYGRGATELDALEALRPGSLRNIVREEIRRYHDRTLESRLQDKVREVREQLKQANEEAVSWHAEELRSIQEEHQRHAQEYNDKVQGINERFSLIQATIRVELTEPLPTTMAALSEVMEPFRELPIDDVEGEEDEDPLFDSIEPEEGREDEDPLFDSKKSYEEQVRRFKRQQGKPLSGKEIREEEEKAYAFFMSEKMPKSNFKRRM
jgi:hypothetical protein